MTYDPSPVVARIRHLQRVREAKARALRAVTASRALAPFVSGPTAAANATAAAVRADLRERLTRRLAFGATILPAIGDGRGGCAIAVLRAEPATGKDPRTVFLSVDKDGVLRHGVNPITLTAAIAAVGGSVREL